MGVVGWLDVKFPVLQMFSFYKQFTKIHYLTAKIVPHRALSVYK